MPKKKLVVVGLSGGVDSAVAAYLLKEEGYEVVGLFMKNWDEVNLDTGVCSAEVDYKDVLKIGRVLNIPVYSTEFIKEYQDSVFSSFISEYKKGRTPNPDILCNREIKFDLFLREAKKIGGDYLATGHYARIKRIKTADRHCYSLHKGIDRAKDQTYFLYTLKEEILAQTLFPLGEIKKDKVRAIARQIGLPVAEKKDSTGICFIGEKNFRRFLSSYLKHAPGEFKTLSGKVVGQHLGSPFYTIGQRKGLGLGGAGEPWYVVAKDQEQNTIYVERGESHPGLFRDALFVSDLTWVRRELVSELAALKTPLYAKLRYRQDEETAPCRILLTASNCARVEFETAQRGVSPGQSIVFYRGKECLGGGIIDRAIPKNLF